MTVWHYALIAAGSVLWAAPFPFFRKGRKGLSALDRRARWGVLLECLGYTLLWQGSFWTRSPAPWRTAVSILLFAAAGALSWTSARALGRQLRVDAALGAEHELICSGPYRLVRHPIYTSMLCVVLGTGLLISPWYLLAAALAIFLAGTEIRMRVEEDLLEARFGDRFRRYRRDVPRFIPFVKVI